MIRVSLDEVLESNELVLVDTCLASSFRGINIVNRKNHIVNRTALRDLKTSLERFLQILNYPSVTTIPEVPTEFQEFLEFLSDEVNTRYGKNRGHIPRKYQKSGRDTPNLPGSFTKDKKLLEQVMELAQISYSSCRQIEVEISDPRYETLVEMLKTADQLIGLKKSTISGNPIPNHTDERLVAFLYWASLDQKISPVLLTRDKDFLNLLGITPSILGSLDFLPYNADFIEASIRNPFRLYLFEKEKGKEIITMTPMGDDSRVLIKSDPQKNIVELKDKIYDLWKQYSEYSVK